MKGLIVLGFRFRRQIGPKWLKVNIGKNGVTSVSYKIAKGVTYNSRRGLTLGARGTGLSYSFGRSKKNGINRQPSSIGSRQVGKVRLKKHTALKATALFILVGILVAPLRSIAAVLLVLMLIWFILVWSFKGVRYIIKAVNQGISKMYD